jgi:hypothetical protein
MVITPSVAEYPAAGGFMHPYFLGPLQISGPPLQACLYGTDIFPL